MGPEHTADSVVEKKLGSGCSGGGGGGGGGGDASLGNMGQAEAHSVQDFTPLSWQLDGEGGENPATENGLLL